METVHRLQLPFKLDQLTEGRGNCFPISIIQQCRRPEISSYLRPALKHIGNLRTGPLTLRTKVKDFVKKSKTQRVMLFKKQYEETDGTVNRETWHQYWERMATDKTWVDYWFIQATAWFLQLNIWIVATSSTDNSPYIEVSGNMGDGSMPCDGPIITLGTKSNVHYQSLLPIEIFHFDFNEYNQDPDAQIHETRKIFNAMKDIDIEEIDQYLDSESKGITSDIGKENSNNDEVDMEEIDQYLDSKSAGIRSKYEPGILEKDPNPEKIDITSSDKKSFGTEDFIYESSGLVLAFLKLSDDYIMRCPFC